MNEPLHIQLGRLIEKHGHTNQSLADITGVSIGTISGIRSGQNHAPSFEAVSAIMKALGESIDALVGIVPPPVQIDDKKLDAGGYTEVEKRAIFRWAGSEIARSYQAVVATLEARVAEKDDRLLHRSGLLDYERKRARQSMFVSYAALGMFALLFLFDFFIPNRDWVVR